ncbi:MAG: lysophospholipid acyltransferase family protein [Filomicrobium sp.]
MKAFRAVRILIGFFALTVPLMPVQAVLLRVSPKHARTFPHWYHRQVCKLLGIRFEIDGEVAPDQSVLIVANHVSWLDIPVISAVAPVSFIAKKEVGGWPFVSSLAKLQRTVFVDRARRTAAAASANEIASRLAAGDKLVLFAEGTSSDGNRVLPFKTSLFAAAKPTKASQKKATTDPIEGDSPRETPHNNTQVQTLTICYTHLHGVPIERADRPLVGWFGDMDLGPHAWELLSAGPLDVRISLGDPIPLHDFADRKALARQTESEVRTELVRILRGRDDISPNEISAPSLQSYVPRTDPDATGRNWV